MIRHHGDVEKDLEVRAAGARSSPISAVVGLFRRLLAGRAASTAHPDDSPRSCSTNNLCRKQVRAGGSCPAVLCDSGSHRPGLAIPRGMLGWNPKENLYYDHPFT